MRKGLWVVLVYAAISWLFSTFPALAQDTAVDYYARLAQDNKNMALSVGSVPAGGALSFGNIFAGMLFGAIGLAAFIYGKKNSLWRPMVLGIALMVFPYFPMGTLATYLVGAGLTAALFFWRE